MAVTDGSCAADCRLCGRIFCAGCSSHQIDAANYEYAGVGELNGKIRVCDLCYNERIKALKSEQSKYLDAETSFRDSVTGAHGVAFALTPSEDRLLPRGMGRISEPLQKEYNTPLSQYSTNRIGGHAHLSSHNLQLLNSADQALLGRSRRLSDASVLRPYSPSGRTSPYRNSISIHSPLNPAFQRYHADYNSQVQTSPVPGVHDHDADHDLPLTTPAPFRKILDDDDKLPSPRPDLLDKSLTDEALEQSPGDDLDPYQAEGLHGLGVTMPSHALSLVKSRDSVYTRDECACYYVQADSRLTFWAHQQRTVTALKRGVITIPPHLHREDGLARRLSSPPHPIPHHSVVRLEIRRSDRESSLERRVSFSMYMTSTRPCYLT